MKPYISSLINAILLIALGAWGYFSSPSPSLTALLPVAFGTIIIVLNPGLKKENKAIAHVVVLLTFIILLGLFMPLKGALSREDAYAVARVSIMLAATLWAMVTFIKSFIDARRK